MSLTLGQHAPSFTARNQHGELVTTHGLRGSPAVIIFYPWAFSASAAASWRLFAMIMRAL